MSSSVLTSHMYTLAWSEYVARKMTLLSEFCHPCTKSRKAINLLADDHANNASLNPILKVFIIIDITTIRIETFCT